MERKRDPRAGLLLMELMAAILIFALAGAVCLRLTVEAERLSARALSLTEGVREAATAAELLRSADSAEEAMDRFHRAWPQGREAETFLAEIRGGILSIRPGPYYIIIWYQDGAPLYTLEIWPGWEAIP